MLHERLIRLLIVVALLGISPLLAPIGSLSTDEAAVPLARPELLSESSAYRPPGLGPEIQVSPAAGGDVERHGPAVAYSPRDDQYLVVWRNDHVDGGADIEARAVGANGDLYPSFEVFGGDSACWNPAIVYNAEDDVFLIVWGYDAGSEGQLRQIWGRLVDLKGNYLSNARLIATDPDEILRLPRVAWNSRHNEYVVVWSALKTGSSEPTHVVYFALSPTLTTQHSGVITSASWPARCRCGLQSDC